MLAGYGDMSKLGSLALTAHHKRPVATTKGSTAIQNFVVLLNSGKHRSATLRNIVAVVDGGSIKLLDIKVLDIELHTTTVDAVVDYRIEHKGVVGAGRYGKS
jgi:hypothetical protein